jgi:hypothetical protein
MDKPVFIIEMPQLNDEQCAAVQDFLWDVIRAFEARYFHQLRRYHQKLFQDDDIGNLF